MRDGELSKKKSSLRGDAKGEECLEGGGLLVVDAKTSESKKRRKTSAFVGGGQGGIQKSRDIGPKPVDGPGRHSISRGETRYRKKALLEKRKKLRRGGVSSGGKG